MNYYPHHIGDFDKATRHLTRIERSIYRDLLDTYYDTESPLTLDLGSLCRKIIARTDEERTAVEQVLNEFFTETPNGWYHDRCEDEIDKYRKTNSQKSIAGKASAAKREEKRQQAINGCSTGVELPLNGTPTNQEPRTKNQIKEAAENSGSLPGIPVSDETASKHKVLIFSQGVELLKLHGASESSARSFLGKYAGYDECKLAGVIGQLMAQPKVEPKAYIVAAMTPKKREVVL